MKLKIQVTDSPLGLAAVVLGSLVLIATLVLLLVGVRFPFVFVIGSIAIILGGVNVIYASRNRPRRR
jgi:hypothetical protein